VTGTPTPSMTSTQTETATSTSTSTSSETSTQTETATATVTRTPSETSTSTSTTSDTETSSSTQSGTSTIMPSLSPSPTSTTLFDINYLNNNNETNSTNASHLGLQTIEEIGANMNVNTPTIADSPAALGGIGAAVALIAIIGAFAAYSFFGKKPPPKKVKKPDEPFSELQVLGQENALFTKVNALKVPTNAQRVQISSLNTAAKKDNITTTLGNAQPNKVSFNPITAAAKAATASPISVSKTVQQAIPLDMYKAHNVNLDRVSVKRVPRSTIKMPQVVETKVGFQPIKKEWKPQLARNDEAIRGTRKAEMDHLNILFNK
jgi:hypothetical protein